MAYIPNTMVHCPNCGTDYTPQLRDIESTTAICPVCKYALALTTHMGVEPQQHELMSIAIGAEPETNNFERRLSSFVQQAHTGGMSFEDISTALRDELAFVATLSNPGHRHVIQIIDLGPEDTTTQYTPPEQARQILQRPQ